MTIAEIGGRIDALELWGELSSYHWALKPRGTALPYFCVMTNDGTSLVKARVLLLEGWQTFQDYVRARVDHNFGFYSAPIEFPHYELVMLQSGGVKLLRCDPGYVPADVSDAGVALCEKMLWEVFGVMMRIETDRNLPLKFADEQAIFTRVEGDDGHWRDEPMAIPASRPHVERISFAKDDLKVAKDLPFATEETIELDFRMAHGLFTREPRPRYAYVLAAIDGKTGERIVWDRSVVNPESGLRGLWESMPPRILRHIISRGRVPGEIKILNSRMFRMVRPLCMSLPFKLSLHDSLPRLEAEFAKG